MKLVPIGVLLLVLSACGSTSAGVATGGSVQPSGSPSATVPQGKGEIDLTFSGGLSAHVTQHLGDVQCGNPVAHVTFVIGGKVWIILIFPKSVTPGVYPVTHTDTESTGAHVYPEVHTGQEWLTTTESTGTVTSTQPGGNLDVSLIDPKATSSGARVLKVKGSWVCPPGT